MQLETVNHKTKSYKTIVKPKRLFQNCAMRYEVLSSVWKEVWKMRKEIKVELNGFGIKVVIVIEIV